MPFNENVTLRRTKTKSFTIDSILKMDKTELIKIPKLAHIMDTQKVSGINSFLEGSLKYEQVVKCDAALDLSVNILSVEKERFRKSFQDHAQTNSINGLYTNKSLSDEEHLAEVKGKHNSLLYHTPSIGRGMDDCESDIIDRDDSNKILCLKRSEDDEITVDHKDDGVDLHGPTSHDISAHSCSSGDRLDDGIQDCGNSSGSEDEVCDVTYVDDAGDEALTLDDTAAENGSFQRAVDIKRGNSYDEKKSPGWFYKHESVSVTEYNLSVTCRCGCHVLNNDVLTFSRQKAISKQF